MANLNRIIIIGRITGDPDAKFTVEGLARVKFELAVSRFAKEGMPPAVDLIDVVALGKLAEASGQVISKGKVVLVEGRIQVRSFEVAGGQRKWATEVVAKSIQVMDGAAKLEQKAGFAAPSENMPALTEEAPGEEEDLPF